MQIAVRITYPETGRYDWFETLKQYEEVGSIEIAFYFPKSFLEKVSKEAVIHPFRKLNLRARSIHLAHGRITEPEMFENILRKSIDIAKALNCNTLVVHPSYGRLEKVKSFIDQKIDALLNENSIFLCWETFMSKRRVFSGIEEITQFCSTRTWHRVCYDFSHIHKPQEEVLKEIEANLKYIRVFHVSNRIAQKKRQHLPIFYKEEKPDLDFEEICKFLLEKGFSGHLVLEYMPEYTKDKKDDALILINKFGKMK